MAIKPWLITWEIVNPHNLVPDNLIAGILPNQSSIDTASMVMQLLYMNEGGYIQHQLRIAKRDYGHKVHSFPPCQEPLYLGESPFLKALHVINFEVKTDEKGDQVATWMDRQLDIDDAVKSGERRATHFVLRRRTYRKSSKMIVTEPPIRSEIVFSPRRRRAKQ